MANVKNGVTSPVGPAFEDLSIEEMSALQGSGRGHAHSTSSNSTTDSSSETSTSSSSSIAPSFSFSFVTPLIHSFRRC